MVRSTHILSSLSLLFLVKIVFLIGRSSLYFSSLLISSHFHYESEIEQLTSRTQSKPNPLHLLSHSLTPTANTQTHNKTQTRVTTDFPKNNTLPISQLLHVTRLPSETYLPLYPQSTLPAKCPSQSISQPNLTRPDPILPPSLPPYLTPI